MIAIGIDYGLNQIYNIVVETAVNFRFDHLSIGIIRYRKDQKARAEMYTHCWDNGVLLDVVDGPIQWQRARAYVYNPCR